MQQNSKMEVAQEFRWAALFAAWSSGRSGRVKQGPFLLWIACLLLLGMGCHSGQSDKSLTESGEEPRPEAATNRAAVSRSSPAADTHQGKNPSGAGQQGFGKEKIVWKPETLTVELAKKITASDWGEICKLKKLENLILDGGGFGNNQLDDLLKLRSLEHLRIRNFPADDESIRKIVSLPNLRIVNLPQACFSNRALGDLAKIPRLQLLRFSSPNVDDRGIQLLKNVRSLRALHLIRVPVTDGAVDSLCAIETLESLYLDGSEISDQGFARILDLRPDIHLHVDQVHLDFDPNRHQHAP